MSFYKPYCITTTRRQAAPSYSAAVASPPLFSTTPGGDSVIGTVVAAWEAVVPTGGMAPEEKRFQAEEEKEKPFKYNEKEKKRIQDKEEEPWTSLNGIAPPPCHGRSSRTSTKFQGYQPRVERSDLTLHEVTNYFVRMSGLPRFDGTFKNYPAFERK